MNLAEARAVVDRLLWQQEQAIIEAKREIRGRYAPKIAAARREVEAIKEQQNDAL